MWAWWPNIGRTVLGLDLSRNTNKALSTVPCGLAHSGLQSERIDKFYNNA